MMTPEIHRAIAIYGMSRKEAEQFVAEQKERDRQRRAAAQSIEAFWSQALEMNVTVPEN